MITIKDMIQEAHSNAVEKGFWATLDITDDRHILACLMLITTEVAEAAEAVREGDGPNFREELADICIRVFDLAGGIGLDLEYEITKKMAFNRDREPLHGKKC